jgi:L-alanine-DL-glutamate epimerase-like enolase superfamily enzyme
VKITDIKVETSIVPVKHQFVWRKGLPGSGTHHDTAKITVETDEGVTGVAYSGHGAMVKDMIERSIKPDLLGYDPLMKEYLWHRVWELDRLEETPIYGLGLIDIALWDLNAKVANMPLYKMLGGFRDRIPVYASTVTYSTIEEFLEIADQCLDLGFRAIKLHAWGDPKQDAKLGQALRNHVGPDIELMYDGSAGFDLVDAIYVGRALAEAGFFWYEEPMREFNIDAYRRLRDKVDIPLLSGETSDGAHFNSLRYSEHHLVRVAGEDQSGDRRAGDRSGRLHLAAGRARNWLGVLRRDGLLGDSERLPRDDRTTLDS